MRRLVAAFAVVVAGCSGSPPADREALAPAPARPVTLSLVGTSDLHGRIDKLPLLAGYLVNLRDARERDGGGVVLIDAGDMFQGTLESNTTEGAPVIAAYNHLAYDAAAIGNHEFDFGPVGAADSARGPGQDPRGALRARAGEARFPLLLANMVDASSGERPPWANVASSVVVERAGVKVGIIGVTTMSTPRTTLAANVVGLAMRPIAGAIAAEAAVVRAAGADVVVVAAHAGSSCTSFDDPDDLSSCDQSEEVFEVARALAPGTVHAIVGGHTHQAVAHRVNGIAIVQSYAHGKAFGRVDILYDRAARRVTGTRVYAPQYLCRAPKGPCETHSYEGGDVTPSAELARLLEPTFARVRSLKSASLGVRLVADVRRAYREESALGNLFTDLMLAARPDADAAVTNGGGLRADLPAGLLTYGHLYEAMPFDNRLAFVAVTGAQLERVFAHNLGVSSGVLSVAGLRVSASCRGPTLEVTLTRSDGRTVADGDKLTVITNSYLASGGDGLFAAAGIPPSAVTEDTGATMRDEMAAVLRARGASLDPAALHDPARPRLRFPGTRPVRCP